MFQVSKQMLLFRVELTFRWQWKETNPSGHYKLDLSLSSHRTLAEQIIRCANAQAAVWRSVSEDAGCDNFIGGPRDYVERNLLNCTLNGEPFEFPIFPGSGVRIPPAGTWEFDFISTVFKAISMECQHFFFTWI